MRKTLRIILAPFVFIVSMAVTIVPFPFGIICFIMGGMTKLGHWILERPDDTEWGLIFCTFTYPYWTTRDWIKGELKL